MIDLVTAESPAPSVVGPMGHWTIDVPSDEVEHSRSRDTDGAVPPTTWNLIFVSGRCPLSALTWEEGQEASWKRFQPI